MCARADISYTITVATKVALHSDGAERRWVRQAVMGVLRWRDLPGTRSSTLRSVSTIEVKHLKTEKISIFLSRQSISDASAPQPWLISSNEVLFNYEDNRKTITVNLICSFPMNFGRRRSSLNEFSIQLQHTAPTTFASVISFPLRRA